MRSVGFDPLVPPAVIVAVVVALVAIELGRARRGVALRRRASVRRRAMVVLAVIAAVDPTVGGGQVTVRRSDANVLFVVDTTGSMVAEDYDGDRPRLEGVRSDVLALADEFPGAHFSLITFNARTRVIVPWTIDRGALDSAVPLLRQEWTFYAQGSRLDAPLTEIRKSVPRRDPLGDSDGFNVVFFMSDGEQTVSPAPRSFASVVADISGGAVLGYGTEEGARMRVYLGRDDPTEQYIHDYATGTDAISRIDEALLEKIAGDLGVPYVHRTNTGGIEEIVDDVVDAVGTAYGGERETVRRLYWIPAFGVVGLALWQLAVTVRELLDANRVLGAPSGRRRHSQIEMLHQ